MNHLWRKLVIQGWLPGRRRSTAAVVRPPLTIHSQSVLKYPPWYTNADFRLAPSQWETVLLCNDVSHRLGTGLESALYTVVDSPKASVQLGNYFTNGLWGLTSSIEKITRCSHTRNNDPIKSNFPLVTADLLSWLHGQNCDMIESR